MMRASGGNENVSESAVPVGAVMVVGGGIGGIQASLDLAESGFRVYLVEEESAIGGVMAQLDKTFPTNDCSMCIISPKLVEVGRHLNIDILSHSEVESVSGEAGNFSVRLRQRPRFIDMDACTGCGDCAKVCPVQLPSEFDTRLISRKAVYKRYPQAIPNAYAIDKRGVSPCKDSCPAGIHVQGYVALIGEEKYREALALIRKNNPFPSICGRVCTHPCETSCTRGRYDDPVAIMSLKRFVTDWEVSHPDEAEPPPQPEHRRDERIAVVGAGPAGLSAAYFLAREGYRTTVFESRSEPGGWMRWGIPEYRLPRSALYNDIDYITKLGVDIRTGTMIGKNLTIDDLMNAQGYKAVFLAAGAQKSLKLGIDGENLEGVLHGVDYLQAVQAGEDVLPGSRVAVIGGGNVAIDAARTALRKGAATVHIIYRRSRNEMPALAEEVDDAEQEGVAIQYLAAPVRIAGRDGKVCVLECVRMELGEPDESGRRRPVPVPGSEFTMGVDAVVPAIGQSVDLSSVNGAREAIVTGRGTVAVDPVTFATSVPGLFAGGDMVTGPATVVEAVGAGRQAAVSIARYLQGVEMHDRRDRNLPLAEPGPEAVTRLPRLHPFKRNPQERIKDFKEVDTGYSADQARTEASRCLNCGVCSECLQCVDACLARAIHHDDTEKYIDLSVGSIVLAPGYELTDPCIREEFGYRHFANVITSLEFERILSASGPFQGHIKRPSDHAEPCRIAWIQCVGSRDVSCGKGYCSSVCCMYATKEAIIAREHAPDIQPTVFYMDIRAYGKGFDLYYERARQEHGVRYVRCEVSKVMEKPCTNNLVITYVDEQNSIVEEEFDLVVLSLGISTTESTRSLAKTVGVALDRYGFCVSDPLRPMATSRQGVFVCGAFESPKDIPETVCQASGAAACASGMLSPARGSLARKAAFPPEHDVGAEPPRIGVFVCHCGINIGGVVDVPAVREYAAGLPDVAYVDENLYTCSQDTQSKIKDIIRENGLNRIVVASCSPRTHESLFQETIREAGLNKYLFEMANIRDQCSWVHMDKKKSATEKAKDLVRMAVASARYVEPLYEQTIDVVKRALVVGGGAAGMTAALGIAEQGFDVVLVEKHDRLGGNLHKLHYTLDGTDTNAFRESLISRVTSNPLIHVVVNAEIVDFGGFKGNFKTGIISAPGMAYRSIEHGAVIIATGAEEQKPALYLYGDDERVVTQQELEEKIDSGSITDEDLSEVVMIQCVGSRIPERPYCSRVCCATAIKNALSIKQINPSADVYILYRDIRTYGLFEEYYTRARKDGVYFIRYDLDNMPKVDIAGGALRVAVNDPALGDTVVMNPGQLVLSTAVVPRYTDELSALLKLQRTSDKFFLEAHMKLRPVDLATDGMYVCGLAHSPKTLGESISQASAAVSRACTLLSHDHITVGGIVARVDDDKCAACLTCVRVCPYGVPFINDEGVAQIDAALCQGCGSCAAECPGKAIELQHSTDRMILEKSTALFKREAV